MIPATFLTGVAVGLIVGVALTVLAVVLSIVFLGTQVGPKW